MKNYSRQREEILRVLRSTDRHPTAGTVYEQVRRVIPNISLATVYRNLAVLRDEGEILSISVRDGSEHFDGNTAAHLHLHCRRCGAITDAHLAFDLLAQTAQNIGFSPESAVYVVHGICKDCKQEMMGSDHL